MCLVLGAAIAISGASGAAAEVRHRTEYSITLSGLPIARASFSTTMDRTRYVISGNIRSAGIVDIITSISAETSVRGTMQNDRLQAQQYVLSYTKGKRNRLYTVNFRNGNVTSTSTKPEPRRPRNWVPVTQRDLRKVLDPISGIIIPGNSKVCPKTLPIFDGETRMDLVLAPKGAKSYTAGKFRTDAIVCSVRFVPKSGFRKGRKDIAYLSRLNSMEIWFAKAENVNVYAPVYVRIPTDYGPVAISAVKFGN
ncbi:DUF3108 domain-containing protein [Rhizobiaceae bacterium n13]|uniref:DUF3108 domain-containing protein n=2 Tax=Ferirhizobium litorale TaxID=2927786 RepID=A0AAE3QEG4_9HYPH|nr:DUF3108 domain-containing protein [Fererhizobium litorale]MDI7862591.1 DUF3108 domain-containing protein [Fererhizobium litorale]MDI7923575.1 DUF3108 domain-containing protein [Fererhizobium litorale]